MKIPLIQNEISDISFQIHIAWPQANGRCGQQLLHKVSDIKRTPKTKTGRSIMHAGTTPAAIQYRRWTRLPSYLLDEHRVTDLFSNVSECWLAVCYRDRNMREILRALALNIMDAIPLLDWYYPAIISVKSCHHSSFLSPDPPDHSLPFPLTTTVSFLNHPSNPCQTDQSMPIPTPNSCIHTP